MLGVKLRNFNQNPVKFKAESEPRTYKQIIIELAALKAEKEALMVKYEKEKKEHEENFENKMTVLYCKEHELEKELKRRNKS